MIQNSNIDKRIQSIDTLRGIVMVLMALDHVRDYFHITANTDDPLNLATTTPLLFFTRWITHFCAPTFVFLSGTSIYLQSLRKTKRELSSFLFKRGLWLIFIEMAVVSFGWSFNPHYNFVFLQVIWAIGISMVLMSLIIYLPYKFILALGLIIVFGHNLLDKLESAPDFKAGFLWDLVHHGFFKPYAYAPSHSVFIVYAFAAWTGVMMLGYCTGIFFTASYSKELRSKILLYIGSAMLFVFCIDRYFNFYGDPVNWTYQKNNFYTFLSFINVDKYPPSLLFLLITIGIAIIKLSFLENFKNAFTRIMNIYGRTAFFYYILHIYFIHLLSAIAFFTRGHYLSEATQTGNTFPFYFLTPGEGYPLPIVYLVWLFVVIALYPLCKWYDNYKTSHKEKWWLSYL